MAVKRTTLNAGGVQFDSRVEVLGQEEIVRLLTPVVDTDMRRRAEAVADRARALAPKRTGTLAGSIRVEQARDVTGKFATGYTVTANTPYALYVHEGTAPHVIKGRPLLGFFWARLGRFVVLPEVNHPGTKARPFLADAITAAGD